jgi:hypothetical protein
MLQRRPYEPVGAVFLRRDGGDKLYLSRASVAEAHVDRFYDLKIGDFVWHGIAPPRNDKPSELWRATEAEFYSPEEQAAMQEL